VVGELILYPAGRIFKLRMVTRAAVTLGHTGNKVRRELRAELMRDAQNGFEQQSQMRLSS
jgi:hypothetical protein